MIKSKTQDAGGAGRRATVFGAAGFVGSALAAALAEQGWQVNALTGRERPSGALGHVFFCAGTTSDFRTRRFDTIEAHVTLVANLLKTAEFDSFVYLSTTRIYRGAESGREETSLHVNPNEPHDLYNLSKLTGESICLTDPRPMVRIARLSNVYGAADRSENFLTSVLRDAIDVGRVHIGIAPEHAKDYVALEDVVTALARFPDRATSRLINLASGVSVTNRRIATRVAELTGADFSFGDDRGLDFPVLEVPRLRDELGVVPRQLDDALPELVAALTPLD